MTAFVVTDAELYNQLADGSAFDGLHQRWLYPGMQILTEDGPRPAQHATWYLHTGQWSPVYPLCGETDCIKVDHLTDSRAAASEAKDDELMKLVQRSTISLASLYKKGKARGLISARSEYR